MLPDRVLVFEEPLGKRFIDHSHFSRGGCILLRNWSTRHDFGAQGIEELWHRADEPRCCIVLGSRLRLTFYPNAVIPAIPSHRGIECRGRHTHSGNLLQMIYDLPEHRFQLFRLVISQHEIDPRDVPALSLEPKILVLQVPQALAEESGCGEQYERHRCLRDYQGSLRPRAPARHRTVRPAKRLDRVSMRSHPRWRNPENYSRQNRRAQCEEKDR